MRIPRFQECDCGHLGHQHKETGECGRCDCKLFHHPSAKQPVEFASERPHYRKNPVAPPTRDSGTR